MKSQIPGFTRPYQISITTMGDIIVLCKTPIQMIYIFSNNGTFINKNIEDLGITKAPFLAVNAKDQILILDDEEGLLYWLDVELNNISSMKLPGSTYGSMVYSKEHNSIFISVLDSSLIIKVRDDKKSFTSFFDYSQIIECNNVHAMSIIDNRLILIDTQKSALFDVLILKDKYQYKKHLEFGRQGQGKVRNPTDIHFLKNFIVVHDNRNYLLQFFNYDLEFIFQIGSKGHDLGYFDLPIAGHVFKNNLYVCDQNNDRIIELNPTLKKFKIIIENQFVPGLLRRPSGITTDNKGRIYVADRSNGVIQRFDKDLRFLDLIETKGIILERPSSISHFENSEGIFFAIIQRRLSGRSAMNIFSLSGENQLVMHKAYNEKITLNDPQDMDVSVSGNFYVADTLNRRIIVVDLLGNPVNQINMAEISKNKRILIKSIFIRDDEHIFTADFEKCIVYHFDNKLDLIDTIDFSKLINQIHVLRAVFATNDLLILCVRGRNQVIVSDHKGKIIRQVNPDNNDDLDWNHPVKMHQTPQGKIIIADKENDRIMKLDSHI